MKKLIAAIAAALFFVSGTTAYAPTQPKEIIEFEPVTVNPMDVTDYWWYPSFGVGSNPQESVAPTPRLITLTKPKPFRYPTVADARRYAQEKLGSVQFSCIDRIFTRESNWRTKARNKYSGAYGIPQALPGSKMAVIANDWKLNPVTQVKWGIRYVNARYGSACEAWEFMKVNGWY